MHNFPSYPPNSASPCCFIVVTDVARSHTSGSAHLVQFEDDHVCVKSRSNNQISSIKVYAVLPTGDLYIYIYSFIYEQHMMDWAGIYSKGVLTVLFHLKSFLINAEIHH